MIITAIDPGTTESGFVIFDGVNKPTTKIKSQNTNIIRWLRDSFFNPDIVIIEEINPYTMGKTTRDTILWSGRFKEAFESRFSGCQKHQDRADEVCAAEYPLRVEIFICKQAGDKW